ncbi:DoxX family protein [Paenibacillaceae bacterium]|nr:DoxX family protein [Paenibacillaceae bacterium]
MGKWIRENVYVAGVMVILRVYLGWMWLTSGFGKLKDGFTAAGYLNNAVENPVMDRATGEALYPTFTAFLKNFALPNIKIIDFLVPVGELLVGVGLILGTLTVAAAFFGLMMNFMFLFAGTISTNPWMVLLGVTILIVGNNAGKFGADYYLMPWLRALLGKDKAAAGGNTNYPG